ncbi:F-box DNA helicase 1 isoform X1 [Bufo gargarizans]|uniref:F-box DNA helicase 1 isoform X1 n=2 Tax=Bufo gargarizans TaxID=30331 RepID=UPI001CF218FF|nr:F-box DNA helicase 1 isoform X1 [Bufo gargarizans]
MKRRKHLTGPECQELAQSREGLCALTQPFNQWNTKQDVHRGLYPRSRAERWFRGKGGKSTLSTSHNILSTDISPSCSHSQEMAEYVSSRMDEDAVESDSENDVHPSDLHSSRKRPYSSIESISQNFLPVVDTRTSSSNFLEEDDDDDEMGLMLDSLSESCYGLLGVTDQSQPSCGHINQFPDELLQCIFSFLPAVDLYRNISLVCHKWKSLVHDSLFIKWKKLYHRYLAKDGPAVMEIEDLLKKNGIIADNPLCILQLVKYFTTLFSHVADSQAILECLKNHHLYEIAEKCVTQRLPELTCNNEAVNAWAVLAVIALLSIKVGDIQRLIRCLWHFRSPLRLVEVMEALYCLATLLFAMREQKVLVSNRIHYNIFYSLYLLENSSSQKKTPSCENARTKPTFNLTNEQQQIINHDIQEGQVMKIMAFAGTGKTSTLIKYAERRPHLRFLYATFNKSIANHADQNFPKNVVCKTFHSLAYQQTGKLYQQRKKLNRSKLTPYTVNFVLPERQAGFVKAKLVVKTLENFLASADEAIETDHVPIWFKNNRGEREMVNPRDQQFAVREADKIWQRMQSLEETHEYAYKMTHDGYLKLWQLRRPNLSSYDAIFVDEAQDCTPSIMEVVLSQKCGKIFVGDPHQQIYTFRGAVNALCEVPHTHIFYLTQSFRFGAEIAYIGATILDACKKIRRKTLVGGNQEGTVREHFQTKVAILSRTNACVFDQAVSVTDKENPSLIHIIGGPENFGLRKIYDIWVLLQPESERQKKRLYIKDRFIATWQKKGFTALKVYAVSSEDKELEGKIAVVEKYNHRIPELVNKIEGCHINDTSRADYILGTVHKAKGMEFDAVQVTDDFAKIPSARHNLERLQIPFAVLAEDEWNLLYVAVTRARKHLTITKSVENFMTLAGEYSLKAELTSQMLKDGPVQCALPHCNNSIPDQTVLTMRKLPITYSDKSEDEGGYICHACAHQRVGPITQLMISQEVLQTMDVKLENVVLPRHYEALLQVI